MLPFKMQSHKYKHFETWKRSSSLSVTCLKCKLSEYTINGKMLKELIDKWITGTFKDENAFEIGCCVDGWVILPSLPSS